MEVSICRKTKSCFSVSKYTTFSNWMKFFYLIQLIQLPILERQLFRIIDQIKNLNESMYGNEIGCDHLFWWKMAFSLLKQQPPPQQTGTTNKTTKRIMFISEIDKYFIILPDDFDKCLPQFDMFLTAPTRPWSSGNLINERDQERQETRRT